MQSDSRDFALMADNLVEWFTLRWRAILYSFTAGALFTIAIATCSAAQAYTKPAGAPEIAIPNHGVTVAIFAAQTAIGHGIGVFEYKPAQNDWSLCGVCFLAEYPTMDSAVDAAGGPGPYVESKRAAINAILASRYPAVSGPSTGSTIDRVNQALAAGSVLRLVDGSPVLAPR